MFTCLNNFSALWLTFMIVLGGGGEGAGIDAVVGSIHTSGAVHCMLSLFMCWSWCTGVLFNV